MNYTTFSSQVILNKSIFDFKAMKIEEENDLISFLVEQGIFSLFFEGLKKNTQISLSQSVYLKLNSLVQVLKFVDDTRFQEYLQVHNLLNKKGVKFLILKGVALTFLEYPGEHMRPCADEDILIRMEDLDVTNEIFLELGFTKIPSPARKMSRFQITYSKIVYGKVECLIDLHWKLSNNNQYVESRNPLKGISFLELWESSRNLDRLNGKTLSKKFAFVHACLHLYGHHKYEIKMIWVYDIHLLISNHSNTFLTDCYNLAERLDILLECSFGLYYSSIYFSTVISSQWVEQIKKNKNIFFKSQIWMSEFSSDLRSLNDIVSKILFVGEHLFPTSEYMKRKYNFSFKIFLPWFYMIRMFSGFFKLFSKKI